MGVTTSVSRVWFCVHYYPPGIIDHSFPSANKYTNFRNIETIVSEELSPLQTQRFVNLIATQYLRNRDNLFTPTKENILPYFNGHSNKSFVTFYNDDTVLIDVKNSKVINDKQLVGIISLIHICVRWTLMSHGVVIGTQIIVWWML